MNPRELASPFTWEAIEQARFLADIDNPRSPSPVLEKFISRITDDGGREGISHWHHTPLQHQIDILLAAFS